MLDRTLAPPFQRTLGLKLPNALNIGNEGSLPIFFLSGLPQNIFKIEVVFNGGKVAETATGLSHFTSVMLEKGTTKKSSLEIAAALDKVGASLEISPGFDFVTVSLYSLKEKLYEIFPLFLEILTSPAFEENEFQLTLDIFKQNIKVNNEKTSYLASKYIRKNIFGKNHPYGSTIEEEDADSISCSDLHRFFGEAFQANSAWVLGDLKDTDVEYIKSGLQGLKYSGKPGFIGVAESAVSFSWQSKKEGRTQASIRLGKRSILKSSPAYPDALMAAHVLGGFFGSRLMKNIREEKGLTYGISASLNAFRNDSLFVIGADVNLDNVTIAIDEIKKEIKNLISVPMEESELSLARNHFIGSLQIDMANIFSVEEKLKAIFLNDLGSNFYQDLLIRIDAITPEMIMEASANYFDSDSLFEVVVG